MRKNEVDGAGPLRRAESQHILVSVQRRRSVRLTGTQSILPTSRLSDPSICYFVWRFYSCEFFPFLLGNFIFSLLLSHIHYLLYLVFVP